MISVDTFTYINVYPSFVKLERDSPRVCNTYLWEVTIKAALLGILTAFYSSRIKSFLMSSFSDHPLSLQFCELSRRERRSMNMFPFALQDVRFFPCLKAYPSRILKSRRLENAKIEIIYCILIWQSSINPHPSNRQISSGGNRLQNGSAHVRNSITEHQLVWNSVRCILLSETANREAEPTKWCDRIGDRSAW